MKHTNQKLKLIGILTPILILAGIILIALTGNKVNILKTQVAEETGKITQETETAKVYDAYMLINELSKIDGTDLNGNGNGIKITTSADDLTLKAYSVVNDELISENENKDIIVPESGIKLKVEGITEGKTYEIEIANGTTDAEYKTDFVKAVITIDATGEDSLVAYVKEITKVVNGEEVTEEGSKEETAIFMYEDETNKIKIKGNGDLEMYYTLGSLDGLTEEELKTATWKEYDKTNGLEVEHNCKIYAKSKYKTGEYSDISEIRVDNIDKLAPTITVTGKEEKAEESTSVTVKITDEENEKYGASGIVAYKMTKMETEPKEWIEIENTKEYETEIGEIQKNGTYYLWAKDKVGNVGHVSFDVTNIEVKVVAVILDSPVESLIGTEYTSLEALQTALEENNITAESGKVVVQLENNVYYETMKIANKDITIDLNGYVIKAKTEEPVIDVESGKVNLVDGKYKFADYITNTEKAEELAGKYTAQNDYGKIINETGNGINIEEGAEFTLGTDDELISIASPEIKAGETGIHNNNGTFNFYDGIITAKITNDGSTTVEGEKVETGITDTPRLYDPTTRQTEGEEGKYTTYLAKVSGIEAVIGKTRYTKIEDAIEAANNTRGDSSTKIKIDVIADIVKNQSLVIDNTKYIEINMNGFQLTNTVEDYVIKNYGKLELTDSAGTSKIFSSTYNVVSNETDAELIINGANLTIEKEGTSSNYLTVIQNNAEANLTIVNGKIKSECRYTYGILNDSGYVEQIGGEVSNNSQSGTAIYNKRRTERIKKYDQYLKNIIKNSEQYYFEKQIDGSWISNNVNVNNSVATSYIKIDLTNYSEERNILLIISASISSESRYDVGYVTVKENNDIPTYTDTDGRICYISGNVAKKEYSTSLSGGKVYYLHLGYRKDGSSNSGTDTFTIHDIIINDYDDSKENGKIVIKNGEINAKYIGIVNDSNASVNIYGGIINLNGGGTYGIRNMFTGTINYNDGKIVGGTAIYNDLNGTVNVNGGIFETTGYGINNNGSGTINYNDGSLISTSDGIFNADSGEIIISGGSISGTYGVRVYRKGSVIVKNGLIKGTQYGIDCYGSGTVIVENGTVIGENNVKNRSVYGIYIDNYYGSGTVKILGGTIQGVTTDVADGFGIYNAKTSSKYNGTVIIGEKDGLVDTDTIIIKGSTCGLVNTKGTGTINWYDGKIIGKTPAINGYLTDVEENKDIVLNKVDLEETAILGNFENVAYVGNDESNLFSSLQEAIDATNENETVTLLKDITISPERKIIISENKKINFNFNGYSIRSYAENNAITNNGSLVMEDKTEKEISNIYGYGKNIIKNNANANIKFESGIYTSDDDGYQEYYYILNNQGNIEIVNAMLKARGVIINSADGTIVMNDGVIDATNIGIENTENGYVELNQGNIINCTNSCIENTTGTVKINGGTIQSKSDGYGIKNTDNGTVDIVGGDINCYKYSVYNEKNGIINISGGEIKTTAYSYGSGDGITIRNVSTGTININGGNISSSREAIANSSTGEINITDGVVSSDSTAIYNYSNGVINISGGTIKTDKRYGTIINNSGAGTIKMTGGELLTEEIGNGDTGNKVGIYNRGTGKVEVTGGTITVDGGGGNKINYGINNEGKGSILVKNTTINVSGLNTVYGIYNKSTGSITIGEKDGEMIEGRPKIKTSTLSETASTYGLYNVTSGSVNFYDGVIEGKENCSKYGVISDWESGYNIIQYKSGENEKYTLDFGYEVTVLEKINIVHLESNDTSYSIINEAIENAASEDRITLLMDTSIKEDSEDIIIPENKNIAFDLGDYTIISNKNNIFTNQGTFELIGNGRIKETNGIAITNGENARELKITSGNIETSGTGIVNNGDGKVMINGGIIDSAGFGIRNIKNGYIELNQGSIINCTNSCIENTTGTVKINGGTIQSKSDGYGIKNTDNGTVDIVGGDINCYKYSVYNEKNGIINISGGEIKTTAYSYGSGDGITIRNVSTGTININGGNISSSREAIANSSTGEINITDGVVSSDSTAIYNYSNGVINISGGTIKTDKRYGTIINNSGAGTIKMTGGELLTEEIGNGDTGNKVGIYNRSTGIVEVTGGTITVDGGGSNKINYGINNEGKGSILVKNTTINVSGLNTVYGIYNKSTGLITIGDRDGDLEKRNPQIITSTSSETANVYGIYNVTSGEINFYDGSIKGKENCSIYGSISDWKNGYNVKSYKTGENEDFVLENEYEVSVLENINIVRLESNQTEYSTMNEALNDSNDEDKIILLTKSFIKQNSEDIVIPENKNIVLDLGDYSIISNKENLIINNGILEITGSGEIWGTRDGAIVNGQTANELKVSSGTIKAVNSVIKNKEAGTVTICGGTITGLNQYANAIYNMGTGLINITEGVVNTTNSSSNTIYNEGTGTIQIDGGKVCSDKGERAIFNVNSGIVNITGGDIVSTDIGIENSGTVNVSGGNIISNETTLLNKNSGIINISNGYMETKKTSSDYYVISNKDNGNVNISGGELEGYKYCIINYSENVIKITDGNMKINNYYYGNVIENRNKGLIEILNGNIIAEESNTYNNSGIKSGVYNYGDGIVKILGGNISVTGGSPVSKCYGIYNKNGGSIIVGENDNKVSISEPSIIGKDYGMYNESATGMFYYYDGVFTGNVQPIYGTITEMPEDYTVIINGTSAFLGVRSDFENTVELDGVYYDSLQTAINIINNSANKSGTIHIWNDMVKQNEEITIPENINVILALEGHEIKFINTNVGIENNGTMKIIDSDDIDSIDETTISSIENQSGIAIQNNGNLTIGQTDNFNSLSPKIIGTTAIAGNEATKLSGTITNTNSTVGMAQSRQIAKIQKMEENNQTVNDTKTKLSSTPDLIVESTEWTKENVPVGMRADITPILNLYLVENIKTAEYKVEYYYDGKIDESKTFTDEVDIGTQINSYEDKVKEGYVLEKVEGMPLMVEKDTDNNIIKVYYTKRTDLSYIVNYLEKETNKTLLESKIVKNQTYGTSIDIESEKVEINGYNYDSTDKTELIIGTDVNVLNIYYTKKNDLSYTVNYLEKGTNKVLYEAKTYNNQVFETKINAVDEAININGYKYDSSSVETLTIGTGENVINIYYTKVDGLSYTINYLEKYTNKVLHEPETKGNQTFENEITSSNEVIEIDGYNYESADPETLVIGTTDNIINIYYTKKNDLSYTVNYLEKDTDKVLHEAKVVENKTFEDVVTSSDEIIEINGYNYELTDPETLVIGTTDNIINIYYTKRNDLSYTVNYLEKETDKVLHESKTVENKTFEDVVTSSDEIIEINGYNYDSVDPENLIITTGENIINIYYTKRNNLSYTVNYLEKDTEEMLHESKTVENKTFEDVVTSSDEIIEINGYNYDSTDKIELIIGTDVNVLNIYYTKKNDLSYTVNYLEKETDKVLHDSKVVENKTFEEVVTSSDEIIEINGYNYDSVNPENLTITTGANVINIYYTKRNDLSYTVNYLEKDTEEMLQESKTVENKTFEDIVTSSDEIIEINGYNYDSVDPETLVIGTNENIINIYYTKRNDLSYTVKYIDRDTKEEIQEEKVVTGKTYKETVNAEEEKTEIYGYNYETADPEVLTIEVENNVINLYYIRKTSTVVIKHCEEGTEQQISENVVITGKVGEKYKAEIAEDIPEKYEFTRAEGETEGTITEEPQTITMYYSKKATKVIVNYINEETQEKMKDSEGQEIESIEIEGKVDDFYTTVSSIKIPSKYELVEIPENSAGRMTIDEIIVNYYYRRKETRVVVHHYEEGTTNKLSENVVITGKVDDTYETKAATDIPVKYEYAYVEGDTAGIMTEEEIHIFYYYKVKESKLTVKYVDKNHDTEIIQADETIGKVDDKYETQAREIEGYTLVGNSENTEGTLKVEATEVIYYYKKNTAVQVKYIDIDTNEELSQETIEGLEGDKYQTESKNFEKYVLVKETENTEGTMTREEIIVKYYYEHLSKGVIEKHIDITTNEILENKVYTGKYGTPYTTKVKTIEGYDVVEERLPENAEGTMIEDVIEVNYYYIAKAKINVEYIDRATGKNLDISDVIIGHEGDTYQTEEKTFEGYDLIEIVGNAEGTMAKGETTVKYIYARPTKVIVRYIDQITGKNLVTSTVGVDVPGDPITIIGHEGDAYQTEEKTITGYDLVKTSENTEGIMTKEDIEVTYYYIAKTKVIVNYIDRATGESLITSDIDPIIITGHEGDTYKTESKTFAGYDLVKTSENTEGRMTKETIEVTYYYARPAKVIVNYLDEETGKTIENIKEEIITGYEGDSYKTEAKELEYYRVARTSENTEGIMEVRVEKEIIDNTTIVNYYYKKKDYNFSIEKTLESIKKDEKTTEITGTIGKIELTKGQLKTAKVQVVYNIKVKNTGKIAGKVKVLEKIPAGMKMNKEDNPEWEISNTIATIETKEIEPGKEENIKVVLTWINSETNLGTIENIAEIQDTSSKSGFKDNNSKDDTDKADIIVAISTGEKTYMSIMGVILIILSSASVVLVMKNKKI